MSFVSLIKNPLLKSRELKPSYLLQRDMNRLIDSFFNEGFEDNFLMRSNWAPDSEISETDKEFLVNVELPGLDKSQVDISIEDDFLTVSGEKKQETVHKDAKNHMLERYYGHFQKSFFIPGKKIDKEKVEASFDKGVLKIHLPKLASNKQSEIKKIEIQ